MLKKLVATKETITAKMSRWAASLEYKQLSQDAVYQAKRFLSIPSAAPSAATNSTT